MSRKEDLEGHIGESYQIIRQYEEIIRTSDRPEEKVRARRVIREQWAFVRGYLTEYRPLVRDVLPDEIAQIETHFRSLDELSRVEQGIEAQEAAAFCRWLEEQLRAAGGSLSVWRDGQPAVTAVRPETLRIRLPTEAEWEKAARGSDGRRYPWGDAFEANRANARETGIGATSPVGCFPGGVSPYLVHDMSGNVWKWTQSLWGKDWREPEFKYPYDPKDGRENDLAGPDVCQVVRGGSWRYSQAYAQYLALWRTNAAGHCTGLHKVHRQTYHPAGRG